MNSKLNYLVSAGAGSAVFIALMGIMSYLPGLRLLGSIRPDYIPMAPSTAISFIALGIILLIFNYRQLSDTINFLLLIIPLLISLFGLLEVAGYFAGIDLNFEDSLVPISGNLNGIPIARMSPATGALFFLAGFSIFVLIFKKKTWGDSAFIDYSIGSVGTLLLLSSFIFCLAYIYGTPLLYGEGNTIPMALTTALGFLFLSISILAIRPDDFPIRLFRTDSTRSYLLRFIFPIAVIAVVVSGLTVHVIWGITTINPAFTLATLTVFTAAIAGIVATIISRHMGGKIDASEEKIRLQQYYLSKGQEIGEFGSWELDLIQNKLAWTEQNYAIFGVPEGKPLSYEIFLECIHPDDSDYVDSQFKKALSGEPYDIKHRLIVNGETKWVREKAEIEFDDDGNGVKAIGFTQDITSQKKAEEEVQRSRILLESSIESAKNMIILSLDRKYRYYYFNKTHEATMTQIYGQQPQIGKCIFDCINVKEDIENLKTHYDRAMSGEGHVNIEQYGEGNSRFYYETRFNPIYNEKGDVIGVTAFAEDITERKLAEAKLQEYSEKLEEMVEERTSNLVKAKEQLVRKENLASLGQLAGSVGHELRNPLGVISNAAFYLNMTLTDIDETAREQLEIIKSEVKTSTRIISELLDFGRVHSINKDKVDFPELIEKVFKKHPLPKKVDFTSEIDPEVSVLFADSGHLEQILTNLITNSYQAMNNEGSIKLIAGKYDTYARIDVSDNGRGIPKENIDKVFEPLFTTRQRGIGLGLAITKSLVELNGGSIKVESTIGTGTTFSLDMPLNEDIAAAD